MESLANRVMLITGASSGIGQAVAHQAAAKGAKLVLVARRENLLQSLAETLRQTYQSEVLVIVADLSHSAEVERIVSETMQYFGRIDVLVSNAGFGYFKPAVQNDWAQIQSMFQVNVFAMMYLSQLVAQVMLTQGNGQIIFVASMAGKFVTPSVSAYGASKAAIIAYSNTLRLELLETGISVTTVNPGPVKTAFFDHDTTMQRYYQQVEQFALSPETIADELIRNCTRKCGPKRELNLPRRLNLLVTASKLLPTVSDYITVKLFNLKG